MYRLIKSLVLAATFAAPTTQAAPVEPTFVLVHGALFTEAGWAPLKAELEKTGSRVVTLNVPGRADDGVEPRTVDIKAAAARVCEALDGIHGPKILVGHSQGGAVITQAFGDCGDEVKGLVYVAAVVPLDGETAFQGLSPERDTQFALCVEVDAEAGLFRLNRSGPLEASFFQDLRAVNPELADQALQSMVSEPIGIGTTPLAFDSGKFEKVAKYYVEATADRVVSLATQRSFQDRTAFDKVYSLATGHSPFLSQPEATAAALKDAARLVAFSGPGFEEIIWEQPELSPRASVEIHYFANQRYDITLVGHQGTLVVPVTGTWSDWCNVSFFAGYDAETGSSIEVTDYSAATCENRKKDRSEVVMTVDGARTTFVGRGLLTHVPGF